jgi:hypothetical protein
MLNPAPASVQSKKPKPFRAISNPNYAMSSWNEKLPLARKSP